MRATLALSLAFVMASAGLGCIEFFDPDTGAPLVERCSNDDTDPAVDVSFERDILQGIFERQSGGCNACHDPSRSFPIGVELGGLDLTSYTSALAGGVNSADDIAIEGQPCESALYLKVTAGPPFGSRMPFGGPPFLTAGDQNLIHDWIAEGARDN